MIKSFSPHALPGGSAVNLKRDTRRDLQPAAWFAAQTEDPY